MKIKLLGWSISSAAVMLLLPCAAVTFVQSRAGMAVTLLLLFVIDPIYAIIMGAIAGRNSKELWSLPVISAILFLAGAWTFFDFGEEAFVIYAGVYLAIGLAAMFVTLWIYRRKNKCMKTGIKATKK